VTEAYLKLVLEVQCKQFKKNSDTDPSKAPNALQLISVIMMSKRCSLKAASDACAAGNLNVDHIVLDEDPITDDHVNADDMLDDWGALDVDEYVSTVLDPNCWSDVDLGVSQAMLDGILATKWAEEMDLKLPEIV
jgi:hypothetical protein